MAEDKMELHFIILSQVSIQLIQTNTYTQSHAQVNAWT